MLIRDACAEDSEALWQFLADNGWRHRMGTREYFSQLLANSQRTAVAWHGTRIIGFARGLSDGLSNGYLSMVVVAQHYRRQGTGRALVHWVMGDNPQITWVLRAGRPGAAEFFSTLGFEPSDIAMERKRHSA
ncbi:MULTISPECIES: GNAT family N-acetyltransferase [unclassified Pseudomonas]|uniref:GNAT family N-acetyltransferase n=1 Tax=unclassified Pseudomonas TaxID=196821 RepID=UPI00083863FC|nr:MULTISPECIES: GNAT family N-acetyltransferase [unclassified Pseudomonas]QIH10613.1 GNAT family N-acetyltransferase [Pseudomonas sp. BIOMIG1BAC]